MVNRIKYLDMVLMVLLINCFFDSRLYAGMWIEGDFVEVWTKAQFPDSTHYREPITGLDFVFIKGGCFEMGSSFLNLESDADERPSHQICVSDFYLSTKEVSNTQYREFNPRHYSGRYKGINLNAGNQPVANVSWDDARKFTGWLTSENGFNFRLPTEAEWEYAAKANMRRDRFWSGGEKMTCVYANVADISVKARLGVSWKIHDCNDGYPVSSPVGSLKKSPFGLYDILGNVQEWVEDRYADNYYSVSESNNPFGPERGKYRVARGGDWSSKKKGVRAAYRGRYYPSHKAENLGFRVVLTQR